MKKWLLGIILGALVVSAQAEAPRFRVFGSVAYGWGGDQLIRGSYIDGPDFELLAGTGWIWTVGADMRITDSLSLQANLGQQRNTIPASDAEVSFQRNPVELLGFYSVTSQARIGVGARKVFAAKVTGTGKAYGAAGTGDYDSTAGAVLEGQYFFTAPTNERSFLSGVSLRFVRENFKLTAESGGTGEEKRGDHMAIGLFFYY